MTAKPKVLFVANKWCAGEKKYGLSEWEMGMQNSLKSAGLADSEIFHMDDYYIQNDKRGDGALLQKITEYQPDIIYLITNKMPESDFNSLQWSTLEIIKKDLKIPIVALWGDLALPEQVKISLAILPYATLMVTTEVTATLARINRPDKYLYTWVPRDPRIFNNPNKVRDIEIVYSGSPRKDRLSYVLYLIKYGVKVTYGGGEAQEHLTTEQYADRYQRSKIALSFARAAASHVINARPFEVMLCGAMLLEQESFETMKLYTPYVDYVPYSSKRDMLRKAKYYLAHDEEREAIARNGQEKTEKLYNAKRFWQIVIDKALGTNSGETYNFDYAIPPESLTHLSSTKAFKMRFINYICSSKILFGIYNLCHLSYWKILFYIILAWLKLKLEKLVPKKVFVFALKIKRKIIKNY